MKTIKFFTLFAAAAIFFACTQTPPPGPVTGPVVYEGDRVTAVKGDYWGDHFEIGLDNFELTLHTCPMDEEGNPDGEGLYISLDFLATEKLARDFPPAIASGLYEASAEMKRFTFLPGVMGEWGLDSGSGVAYYDAEGMTGDMLPIVKGSFEITETAVGEYIVTAEIELPENKTYKVWYVGPIAVKNNMWMTNRPSDVTIPTLTGECDVTLYDVNWAGATYYSLFMYDSALAADKTEGKAEGTGTLVRVDVFTETADPTAVATGTYPLTDTETAGTSLRGFSYWGALVGAWYLHQVDGKYTEWAPIQAGDVKIDCDENDIYTIAFRGLDDYGNKITGSYKGPIAITDERSPEDNARRFAAPRAFHTTIGAAKKVK